MGSGRLDRSPSMVESTRSSGSPRVAVVIPCHDDGATLPQALASLRDQEPHEVVVVDDGSTDERTLALLARLRGEGLTVLRQENAGPGAARMAGVQATTAPYVFPLDADDLVAPRALTALADALDRHPGAAAAWGSERTFGRAHLEVPNPDNLDPWLVTHLNEAPNSALLRRERLLEAGGWQLRSGYEDWDLWMAMAERDFTAVRVPDVVCLHRLHAPRRYAENARRHAVIYDELRARHPALFARRRRNWRRSRAPLRLRLVLPVVGALPLRSEYRRHRLANLAAHPVRLLRARYARR
ncbi:MAG: glycosyltransferase family 2 protein [Gaiellaceae bacterium]